LRVDLEERGHETSCFDYGGSVVQAIHVVNERIYAFSDPRKGIINICFNFLFLINSFKKHFKLGGQPDGV